MSKERIINYMKALFKFIVILTIAIIFIYAFSPSYLSRSMENLAYVVGLGIDKDTETEYKLKVSFQFIQIYALSDSSSSNAPAIFVDSVSANSISSAINELNTYIGKELNLSHCDIIVFSSDVAKEGISTEIYSLVNNKDIRPSTNLVICSSTASSYLENVKPNIEKLVTKYYDTFPVTSAFTGYTLDISIGKFYNRLISDYWENTVSLGEVFKSESSSNQKNNSSGSQNESSNSSGGSGGNSGEQGENSSSSGGGNEESQSSGSSGNGNEEKQGSSSSSGEQTNSSKNGSSQSNSEQDNQTNNKFHIIGKRSTQNIGVAVFKGDTLIGELTEIETLCHLLILNEVTSCVISIPNPNSSITSNGGESIMDLCLTIRSSPKISVNTDGDFPTININLFLDADVLTVDQSSNYTNSSNLREISSSAEKYIKDCFNSYLNKVSKELKVDIDGFGRFAVKHFLTESDWSSYDWQTKYENAKFVINADINVTSSLLLTELD